MKEEKVIKWKYRLPVIIFTIVFVGCFISSIENDRVPYTLYYCINAVIVTVAWIIGAMIDSENDF